MISEIMKQQYGADFFFNKAMFQIMNYGLGRGYCVWDEVIIYFVFLLFLLKFNEMK
jgi:hypothetical protein